MRWGAHRHRAGVESRQYQGVRSRLPGRHHAGLHGCHLPARSQGRAAARLRLPADRADRPDGCQRRHVVALQARIKIQGRDALIAVRLKIDRGRIHEIEHLWDRNVNTAARPPELAPVPLREGRGGRLVRARGAVGHLRLPISGKRGIHRGIQSAARRQDRRCALAVLSGRAPEHRCDARCPARLSLGSR